jgi:hypothetical protein
MAACTTRQGAHGDGSNAISIPKTNVSASGDERQGVLDALNAFVPSSADSKAPGPSGAFLVICSTTNSQLDAGVPACAVQFPGSNIVVKDERDFLKSIALDNALKKAARQSNPSLLVQTGPGLETVNASNFSDDGTTLKFNFVDDFLSVVPSASNPDRTPITGDPQPPDDEN